jgi:hypothetical protein
VPHCQTIKEMHKRFNKGSTLKLKQSMGEWLVDDGTFIVAYPTLEASAQDFVPIFRESPYMEKVVSTVIGKSEWWYRRVHPEGWTVA